MMHEWTVLASHQISFRFYGLAVVNALVLGKIMLIAEDLHFADRLKNKPLIYPIAFKSIAFSALLVVAYIAFGTPLQPATSETETPIANTNTLTNPLATPYPAPEFAGVEAWLNTAPLTMAVCGPISVGNAKLSVLICHMLICHKFYLKPVV